MKWADVDENVMDSSGGDAAKDFETAPDEDGIKMVIKDAAGEMLSFGFKEHINKIYQTLRPEAQVCSLSATSLLEILRPTKKFMREPVRILVKSGELTLEGTTIDCNAQNRRGRRPSLGSRVPPVLMTTSTQRAGYDRRSRHQLLKIWCGRG